MKASLFLLIAPFITITSAMACATQDTDMIAASSSSSALIEDSQCAASHAQSITIHQQAVLYSTQLEDDLFLFLERQPAAPSDF